jgi:GNAT superfamily N-acetyltransferase
MTGTIREAKSSDVKGILDLIASHRWRNKSWGWDRPLAERYLDDYFGKGSESLAGDAVFVLAWNGEIIGVTGWALDRYESDNYWLGWFYVHAGHTPRGLGRNLLAYTEQKLAKKLVSRLFVSTSSHPFYKPAHLFYLSMGYLEVGRIRGYYSSGEDQIILSKRLGQPETPSL